MQMAVLTLVPGNAPDRESAGRHARLQRVRSALATLPERNLQALRAMSLEPTEIAPGLMLWIEHATGWEIDRRARLDYALHAPLDVVGTPHVTASILMLAALSSRFIREHAATREFLRATMECLNPPRALN
jgi:hypothetical protein